MLLCLLLTDFFRNRLVRAYIGGVSYGREECVCRTQKIVYEHLYHRLILERGIQTNEFSVSKFSRGSTSGMVGTTPLKTEENIASFHEVIYFRDYPYSIFCLTKSVRRIHMVAASLFFEELLSCIILFWISYYKLPRVFAQIVSN